MSNSVSADFIVIGSGIVGSLAAREFAQRRLRGVVILEAGPRVNRGLSCGTLPQFAPAQRLGVAISARTMGSTLPMSRESNNYLMQGGPYPYQAEYLRQVGGTTWHGPHRPGETSRMISESRSLYDVGVDWPFGYDDLEPDYQRAEEIMGVSGAPNTGSPRAKPFPMQPVAEAYAMRRLRERLAPEYEVVGNTTARNSRPYDGRPACCGNNSCQPICPIDAQYHGGLAATAAEAAGRQSCFPTPTSTARSTTSRAGSSRRIYYDPDKSSHRVTRQDFHRRSQWHREPAAVAAVGK